MNREAFDHAIRAAGSVLGENEILVIGSQALHASVAGNLPPEAERSMEADVAAFDDPDDRKADLIDGSIGEASMFHQSFGYYAQGVSQSTAVLPVGWRERLVRYESPATNGVVAWCLEVHDLWLSACGDEQVVERQRSDDVRKLDNAGAPDQAPVGRDGSVRVAGDRPDRVRPAR